MQPNRRKEVTKNTVDGILWNYVSIFILSISGLLFNIIIMMFYDATVLGIFNQSYSWYIVFSQVTVFGIQASVTKYSAEYKNDKIILAEIFGSALVTVCVLAIGFSLMFQGVMYLIQNEKSDLFFSIKLAVLALTFFSLNKFLLGFLNGLSLMKPYAVFQALRYILIALSICFLAVIKAEGKYIAISFLIAEFILFIIMVIYLLKEKVVKVRVTKKWVLRHLNFGIRILPSNFVLELNTRADVICLGLLLHDDYMIGIYSFAVLFAEGFYQVFVVLRRSLNPILTEKYINSELVFYWRLLKRRIGKIFYALSLVGAIALMIGYYLLCLILRKNEYLVGILPLGIIGGSIVINAKSIVLGNLFAQTGKPWEESCINLITVGCNLFFNMILIPFVGIIGAAIATGFSYFAFSIALRIYSWKRLDLRV